MSIFGALIGAGSSLLGGILGRNSAKKQARQERAWALEDREYARGTYQRLVEDSEAAGFNPLTALRGGGGAGYTATTAPFLSSGSSGGGEHIANALTNVGSIIANFDPFEDKLREAQYGVMQAQLANLQANTAATQKRMFDVPAVTGRTKVAALPALAVGPSPESGDRTVTNPWTSGQVDPEYLDAEVFEARYGDSEVAQMVYGARNMWADYNHNTWLAIQPHLAPYRKKQAKNESRKTRIRADAARNAADLGFPAGW